jgi:hypothetical protein
MKPSKTTFLFSTLFATCIAAVHCGGDDSNSVPNADNAGSNVGASGENSNGASGDNNSGASGDNSSGASGANGNAGGGNGAGGANGAGGNGNGAGGGNGNAGAGGGAAGGGNNNNNPNCPAAAPMDGAACMLPATDGGRGNGLTCNYTAGNMLTNCGCDTAGRGRDAGRAWNCNTITLRDAGGGGNRDGGFTIDAGACPNGTMNGGMCMTNGEFCRLNNRNCFCFGTNANNRTWRCN